MDIENVKSAKKNLAQKKLREKKRFLIAFAKTIAQIDVLKKLI